MSRRLTFLLLLLLGFRLDAQKRKLDVTNFVVVGEGLAAGMADFSLKDIYQEKSFPARIAEQMGAANFPAIVKFLSDKVMSRENDRVRHQVLLELRSVTEHLTLKLNSELSALSDPEWVAVNTIIEERTVRDLIPRLKAARAQGIVEYPLNKIVL